MGELPDRFSARFAAEAMDPINDRLFRISSVLLPRNCVQLHVVSRQPILNPTDHDRSQRVLSLLVVELF